MKHHKFSRKLWQDLRHREWKVESGDTEKEENLHIENQVIKLTGKRIAILKGV